jgi:hypothetical protein
LADPCKLAVNADLCQHVVVQSYAKLNGVIGKVIVDVVISIWMVIASRRGPTTVHVLAVGIILAALQPALPCLCRPKSPVTAAGRVLARLLWPAPVMLLLQVLQSGLGRVVLRVDSTGSTCRRSAQLTVLTKSWSKQLADNLKFR